MAGKSKTPTQPATGEPKAPTRPATGEPPTQPHIAIFTRFYDSTTSRLEALIAYGIFTESVRDGGFDANDENYSKNIDRLFASIKVFCLDGARKGLLQAANAAIEEKKIEIAKAHKGFRLWGVSEAILGALAWSLFLIVATGLTFYFKPELLEIPRHVLEQLRQGQPHQ
jgi:hypothetical protein